MVGLRLIIVDADLPKRLATELRNRGRPAFSTADLGIADFKDPLLLTDLAGRYAKEPWILVTGDDAMPAEHGEIIVETNATIATVHPEQPPSLTQDAWRRDVVHRWAHMLQTQTTGNVRRYNDRSSRLWAPRSRHVRAIATQGWVSWPQAKAAVREPTDEAPVAPSGRDPDRLPGLE